MDSVYIEPIAKSDYTPYIRVLVWVSSWNSWLAYTSSVYIGLAGLSTNQSALLCVQIQITEWSETEDR